MKIAVFSDVHGNLPALEAVVDDIERWDADQVIINGDLISRGPYSLACLNLVRARFPQARLLKGNHEALVLACAGRPLDPDDPTAELRRFAHWTARQLGERVAELRTWEEHVDFENAEGRSFHVTHGSRLGDRCGIHPEIAADELERRLGEPRDLFVGSHTHRPMTRSFNGTLVVNVGSVGQPLDTDPRAAYGQFELRGARWNATVARVRYDKQRAEQDFVDSGFLDECGPFARLIFTELRESRRHVGPWMSRYLEAVKTGEISVAHGVQTYLERV